MVALPIPVRSNPGTVKLLGSAKVVNAYAERGGDDMKAAFSLVPVAGIKTFGAERSGKCRGMVFVEDESAIYAVIGIHCVKVDSAGSYTELGLIGGDGPVFMARNDAEPQQIVIVASDGIAYVINSDVLTALSLPDFTPNSVTYCGGYFVFGTDAGQFYVSDLQSTDVDALSFATAEGDPDGLTLVYATINTLYLIGRETIEIWGLSGDLFPFARIGQWHFLFGSQSPHTVKTVDNSIVLVGSDNVVYRLTGTQAQPVSSDEVTRLIEAEADKSSLVAFTHQRGLNKFYCLQGTGWTRELNLATGFWHDRETAGGQWHCQHHVRAWGRDIYGDRQIGQLFEGDYTLFTDNGEPLVWGFDTQIVHDAPNGLSFERLALDMETGDGIGATEAGEVMVSWSDDNARTFKGEKRLSLHPRGKFGKRVVPIYGLGQCGSAGRTFRVRVSDPVLRAIAGMDVDAQRVAL